MANDGIPFSRLVTELVGKRNPSRHPFFQVMFSLEPPLAALEPAWRFARMDIHNGSTKFDINLELDDAPHHIEGRLIYNRDLFEAGTIQRMIEDWYTVVAEIVADPSRRISEIVAAVRARKEVGPREEAADSLGLPGKAGIGELRPPNVLIKIPRPAHGLTRAGKGQDLASLNWPASQAFLDRSRSSAKSGHAGLHCFASPASPRARRDLRVGEEAY